MTAKKPALAGVEPGADAAVKGAMGVVPDAAVLLDKLRGELKALGSVLVCYSGGIDSALVLAVAHQVLGANAVGMTAVSHSLAAEERTGAAQFAHHLGARHVFVDSAELLRPGYVANGPDRCFHCKSELYSIAQAQLSLLSLGHIVNGTNADDLGDYRPGLQAARDFGVRSPLAELGFTKADVRAVARHLGIPLWDKPAAACLSSRIPYGTSVTPERLEQIGRYERALRALGFRQVRVRWHEAIARVELDPSEFVRLLDPELREQAIAAGKQAGFRYITLDLQGYRTGSHNEVLTGRSLKVL